MNYLTSIADAIVSKCSMSRPVDFPAQGMMIDKCGLPVILAIRVHIDFWPNTCYNIRNEVQELEKLYYTSCTEPMDLLILD